MAKQKYLEKKERKAEEAKAVKGAEAESEESKGESPKGPKELSKEELIRRIADQDKILKLNKSKIEDQEKDLTEAAKKIKGFESSFKELNGKLKAAKDDLENVKTSDNRKIKALEKALAEAKKKLVVFHVDNEAADQLVTDMEEYFRTRLAEIMRELQATITREGNETAEGVAALIDEAQRLAADREAAAEAEKEKEEEISDLEKLDTLVQKRIKVLK